MDRLWALAPQSARAERPPCRARDVAHVAGLTGRSPHARPAQPDALLTCARVRRQKHEPPRRVLLAPRAESTPVLASPRRLGRPGTTSVRLAALVPSHCLLSAVCWLGGWGSALRQHATNFWRLMTARQQSWLAGPSEPLRFLLTPRGDHRGLCDAHRDGGASVLRGPGRPDAPPAPAVTWRVAPGRTASCRVQRGCPDCPLMADVLCCPRPAAVVFCTLIVPCSERRPPDFKLFARKTRRPRRSQVRPEYLRTATRGR